MYIGMYACAYVHTYIHTCVQMYVLLHYVILKCDIKAYTVTVKGAEGLKPPPPTLKMQGQNPSKISICSKYSNIAVTTLIEQSLDNLKTNQPPLLLPPLIHHS